MNEDLISLYRWVPVLQLCWRPATGASNEETGRFGKQAFKEKIANGQFNIISQANFAESMTQNQENQPALFKPTKPTDDRPQWICNKGKPCASWEKFNIQIEVEQFWRQSRVNWFVDSEEDSLGAAFSFSTNIRYSLENGRSKLGARSDRWWFIEMFCRILEGIDPLS